MDDVIMVKILNLRQVTAKLGQSVTSLNSMTTLFFFTTFSKKMET